MIKDSIFRPIYTRGEKRIHVGYEYRGKILRNTLSSQMFNVNPMFTQFLTNIERIVYEWVEAVKQIKIYANPALDKYEDKIR